LLAGLALRFGVHRFVAALLLNLWFLIALSLAVSLHQHPHITNYIWAQVLAWIGGSALWIVLTFIEWLLRGREDRPPPFPEVPGATSPHKLSPPQIAFAVIRALAIAGCVALAFGLNLSHGLWIPIAAMVAMKPSLEQATLASIQRVAGALIGAAAAVLLLLIPASEHGLRLFTIERALEVVAIVLLMHAGRRSLLELCPILRGHYRGSAGLSGPTAALQLCSRRLPGALGVVRRGDRCVRDVPRESARQANRQSGATTRLATCLS
jgi:hypothetical protein